MKIKDLEQKLASLKEQFEKNEAMMHVITQRRIDADMGDDFRENEPAKLIMERHDVWWAQRCSLISEMAAIKKQIVKLSLPSSTREKTSSK